MGTREPFLHLMLLHGAKRETARSICTSKAIDDMQVIGQIERPAIKLYVTVGAQAKNVPVHIRATFGTTQGLNVGTFRIASTVSTDLQRDAAHLAGKSVKGLHSTSHRGIADDAINSSPLPPNLGISVTTSTHLPLVKNIFNLLLKRGEILSILREANHLEATNAKPGPAYFIPVTNDLI